MVIDKHLRSLLLATLLQANEGRLYTLPGGQENSTFASPSSSIFSVIRFSNVRRSLWPSSDANNMFQLTIVTSP